MFAACKRLGIDDDSRRAMMLNITGKASSTAFNTLDWARLLDHLNKITGHAPAPQNGKPARWRAGCEVFGSKIEAQLADQKLPWRYLTHGAAGKPSMLKRLAGVDRLEFANADGLRAVVAALARRAAKQGPQ